MTSLEQLQSRVAELERAIKESQAEANELEDERDTLTVNNAALKDVIRESVEQKQALRQRAERAEAAAAELSDLILHGCHSPRMACWTRLDAQAKEIERLKGVCEWCKKERTRENNLLDNSDMQVGSMQRVWTLGEVINQFEPVAREAAAAAKEGKCEH